MTSVQQYYMYIVLLEYTIYSIVMSFIINYCSHVLIQSQNEIQR